MKIRRPWFEMLFYSVIFNFSASKNSVILSRSFCKCSGLILCRVMLPSGVSMFKQMNDGVVRVSLCLFIQARKFPGGHLQNMVESMGVRLLSKLSSVS